MLSSNQQQPNFWFATHPLPSLFSSASTTTNKILFETNPRSSSSENSPPRSNLMNYSSSNHFLHRDDWSPTISASWAKGKDI